MTTITKTHIERADVCEFDVHKFITDASDLGWPVGVIPTKLTTDLGNKLPLYLFADNKFEFVYRQELGCIFLHVSND